VDLLTGWVETPRDAVGGFETRPYAKRIPSSDMLFPVGARRATPAQHRSASPWSFPDGRRNMGSVPGFLPAQESIMTTGIVTTKNESQATGIDGPGQAAGLTLTVWTFGAQTVEGAGIRGNPER